MPSEPPPIPQLPAPQRAQAAQPPPDDEIDLSELLSVIMDGRWLILAVAAVILGIGGAYAFLATPIYKADSLIQVEEKGGGIKGLEMLSEMFEGEATSDAEIELIRSRAVLNQVIDKLHLDISAEPRHFPLFGRAGARRHGDDSLASPPAGLSSFAWGGERLRVTRLEVPSFLESQPLRLVAGERGSYTLLDAEDRLLVEGKVGELAGEEELAGTRRASVSLFVADLVARPGTEFTLVKKPRALALEELLQTLSLREKGKKTGIIELEMQGPDRQLIREALDSVMQAYVRQNVERRAAEAEKTLAFIQEQLPVQKAALEESERKLNEYRKSTGKLDLGMEAQALVQRAAEIEKGLTELQLQESEMRQRFTDSHPAMVALRKKLGSMQRERTLLDGQAKTLPETELNSVRLVRDVTVANELYVLLLNKAQELNVVKSGTVGNVRIVDTALVKPQAVKPKKSMILALSLVLGLGAGVALTFLRRALRGGIEDPEVLEQSLGLPVYASIPFSAKQEAMTAKAEKDQGELVPLALSDTSDLAIESLRSLRTSLQFSLAAAKNNVIVISGSRPGVGKSFVSVNLAHVLADAGKRVLLIDADLRKGQLHRYFTQSREGGFAELIAGTKSLEELVHPTGNEHLSFIASGKIPPNPSELLSSARCGEVLEALGERFDLVLMDAPPVLAVTDAALLARHAGVNLLVAKAGIHPLRELALMLSRFQQTGVRPNGFVFNAVPMSGRLYGYGRYRYHYQYEYR